MKKAPSPHPCTILLIDDEEQVLETSRLTLRTSGYKSILTCSDSRKALDVMKEHPVSLVVLDIMMPHLTGIELLNSIVQEYPDVPVIMMTALHDLESIVKCMKLGAFDYLDKPVENLRLNTCIRRALEYRDAQQMIRSLKTHMLDSDLQHPDVFSEIITKSDQMLSIFRYIESIATTSRAVLITGETGTGKELIAKAIHQLSRRDGEYVAINVAGLDDTLFSDSLFGHIKGAFTSADQKRLGLIHKAEGGTLFLDEIADLSIPSQVKLLRLLQEAEYFPLGSDTRKLSEARIVVASGSDIHKKIVEGDFRKDLLYRLQAHHIHLPPLRERPEDIPLLVNYFLEESCKSLGRELPKLDGEINKLLKTYPFPGNIRELESMIFNAVTSSKSDTLSYDCIKKSMDTSLVNSPQTSHESDIHERISYQAPLPTIDEAVDHLIDICMKKNNGNQTLTSRALGITRQGLIARLKRRS